MTRVKKPAYIDSTYSAATNWQKLTNVAEFRRIRGIMTDLLKLWYQAARPRSLTATYAPLLLGGVITITDGVFNLPKFVLALFGALLLQIGANLVNEYVDYNRGTDDQKVAGMGMVLSRPEAGGKLTTQQVLIGAIVTVVGGAAIGILLVISSGPLLLGIGMIGVLVAVTYTAGPMPLAYVGLGEIAVFICMGPLMVLGTYYAVSGKTSSLALIGGLPLAFTVAAILHANNMRDLDADRAANKRTLAVRFGRHGSRIEYTFLIYGAYGILVFFLLLPGNSVPWTILLVFLTLPRAIEVVRLATNTDDPKVLHGVQGMTARLHFIFGLALAGGWLLSVFLPK